MNLKPFLLDRTYGAESEMGVTWGTKGFLFDPSHKDFDPVCPTLNEKYILQRIVSCNNDLVSGFLPNAGRVYLDWSHPEYATPECTTPREVARYLHGTDLLFHGKALRMQEQVPLLKIYRDNTDWHGSYYTSHENYLIMSPVANKPDLNQLGLLECTLSAYLFSQGIWGGSGNIDPVTTRVSASTAAIFRSNKRSLHTMKEMFGSEEEEQYYRRLQIYGEANGLQEISYLKFAITSLVLSMVEAGFTDFDEYIPDFTQSNFRVRLNELSAPNTIRTFGRSRVTALDIQKRVAQSIELFLDFLTATGRTLPEWAYPALDRFKSVLSQIEAYFEKGWCKPPFLTDWMCKEYILEAYKKTGQPLTPDHIRWFCMAYHATDPSESLLEGLYADGKAQRMFSYTDLLSTLSNPSLHSKAQARSVWHRILKGKKNAHIDWGHIGDHKFLARL